MTPGTKPDYHTDKGNKFIYIRQQKRQSVYPLSPNLELSQSFYNFAAKFFRIETFI